MQRFRPSFATDRHLRPYHPFVAVRRGQVRAQVKEPLEQAKLLAGRETLLLISLQAAQLAAQPAALAAPVPQLLAIVRVGRSYFEYSWVIKVVMNQI